MIDEAQRADFENWEHRQAGVPVATIAAFRDGDGYMDDGLQHRWTIWQAFRTADRDKMLALVKYTKDRVQFLDEPDETTMAHFDAHWKGLGNE